MSTFDDLKKSAQENLLTEETKAKSWISAHKGWLIAIGVALLLGIVAGKAFAQIQTFTASDGAKITYTPAPATTPPSVNPPPVVTPPTGVTWMYLNGKQTLAGDFTGGGMRTNYQNVTSSGFNGGTRDIMVTSSVPYGYFIPYWTTNFQLPNPGYTYLLLSLKPTISGDTFGIHSERVGDSPLPTIELMNYGPAAVAGKWGSYKVPLKDLGIYGDKTLYKIVLGTHTGSADSWELDAIGFQ